MQALDSFISSVPSFDGEILIPAILISAQPPGDEPMSDPFTGANVSSLKARVGKWKASAKLTLQKKARKTSGRTAGRIKINEPIPRTSASNPPSGPRRKILIQHPKRYTHHEHISSLTIF
jgi:hypothetical protein